MAEAKASGMDEKSAKKYAEDNSIVTKRRCEMERLALGCTGVRRTTGQHPGGMIVLPRHEEIYSFTPIQHPANDVTSDIITSHFEFVGEGYEVDALHYLIKPVAKEKLCEVLFKAAEKLAEEPPYVVISCEGETVKLYESDILYVESFLHDIVIHTKSRDYKIKENISAFEQKLSEDFFRVHRSYLVNLKAVTRIGRGAVTLCGKTEVPVARGKYDEINRAFIVRN